MRGGHRPGAGRPPGSVGKKSAAVKVTLTPEAETALAYLCEQVGGFDLDQAINKILLAIAKERGWGEP